MVQGVVAFLCELLSGIQPSEVLALTTPISSELNLEGLLSTTRKRAVASTLAYIRHVASPFLPESLASSSPHAPL
jgi:sulfur transfer protein SufE